ncbi:MAG: hypothetical protein AAF845_12565 [Bacteroidota bacterium]
MALVSFTVSGSKAVFPRIPADLDVVAERLAGALAAHSDWAQPTWPAKPVTADTDANGVTFRRETGFGESVRGRIDLSRSGDSVTADYDLVFESGVFFFARLAWVVLLVVAFASIGIPLVVVATVGTVIGGINLFWVRARYKDRVLSALLASAEAERIEELASTVAGDGALADLSS